MHMTLLGEKGLRQLAALNHARAVAAAERLARVPGVELVNDSFFNEFTLRLPKEARPAVRAMAEHGVLGGVSLGRLYPGERGARQRPGGRGHRDRRPTRMSRRSPRRSRRCWHEHEPRGAADAPESAEASAPQTWTGNRALMLEEPLLFEIGDTETTGVDFDDRALRRSAWTALGGPRAQPRRSAWPASPSRETVRHYTRLSRQNYAIDLGLFPLGSCTMKHNPRLNEKVARMPGFADIHPLQPVDTVQGASR